ncbi:MAG: hypothetical protein RIS94_2058 [Pseudomonadota bacterium]
MSRLADHAERRQQVIRIARNITLTDGLEAMTVRAIAKATGYSTAIVSYYFKDKADLLMQVFEEALAISEQRFRAHVDAGQSLLECLSSLLPIDEELTDVWRTWFAFWSLTVSDKGFRAVQVERTELLIATLRTLMDRDGFRLPDPDASARRLFAAVVGISVQAVHDPERWPRDQQTSLLAAEIAAATST